MKVQIQNPKASQFSFNRKEIVLNIWDNKLYIVEVELYLDNMYRILTFELDYTPCSTYLYGYDEVVDFLIIIREIEDITLSYAFTRV